MSSWLEALLDTEQIAIALLDRDLRYVRVNRLLAAFNGKPAEEHRGRSIREMVPLWAEALERPLRGVLESGRPLHNHLLEGTRVSTYLTVLPAWEEGELRGLVVLATDVAARLSGQNLARDIEFETLLIELSMRFIDAPSGEVRASINPVIEVLGLALEVDRVEVCEGSSGEACGHRWLRPGTSAGKGIPPWCQERVARGESVFIAAPEQLPPEAPAVDPLVGAQRLALVPLKIAGEVLGSVLFAGRSQGAPWAPLLARRFQLISEVLANALHRARMDREAAEQHAFEALFARTAAGLVAVDTDTIGEELSAALEALREALGTLRLSVLWLDPERRTVKLLHSAGRQGSMTVGQTLPLDVFSRRAADEVLAGRSTVVQREELAPWAGEAWERVGASTLLAVPLIVGGNPVGLLSLLDEGAERYTEALRRRIELVAQMVAHVLARRDAELAQRAAMKELQELKAKAEQERDYLREELHQAHDPYHIVAESPAIAQVLEIVAAVAPTDATVLVHGETGVGKELIARAIHARSRRAERPLVKVNCAAIPRELFESEFFGHVKGSFSSALRDRQGRFELADKGTLFLDEVGELPLELQSKLLRVLQEGEFERVGDDRTRKVDVRVIAATNRDLARDARAGKFRLDLYYRLSVFPVEVPPLRRRPEDIVPLARHFLHRFTQKLGRPALELSPQHQELLLHYGWPGNVRELAHLLERAAILSPRPPLRLELTPSAVHLPSVPPARASQTQTTSIPPMPVPSLSSAPPGGGPASSSPGGGPASSSSRGGPVKTAAELKEQERANIQAALEQTGGQVGGKGGAAELLGLSPSTLRDRMKALGLGASRPPGGRGGKGKAPPGGER